MTERSLIWLTRPTADSESFATQLKVAGIDTILGAVIDIKMNNSKILLAEPEANYEAILLTSRHAAKALFYLPKSLQQRTVFCVGEATAEAVKAAGAETIIHGDNDVADLLPKLITTIKTPARILYLAGEQTRIDVGALLAKQGITVETQVAYTAEAVTTMPPALHHALENSLVKGVVFYSPRSALLAAELLVAQGLTNMANQIEAYCLSLAVAQAAAGTNWQAIHACFTPTNAAMLDLVVSRAQAVL